MEKAFLFAVFIVILPATLALIRDADLSVSDKGIVTQEMTVSFEAETSHDSITYLSATEPLGVIYEIGTIPGRATAYLIDDLF